MKSPTLSAYTEYGLLFHTHVPLEWESLNDCPPTLERTNWVTITITRNIAELYPARPNGTPLTSEPLTWSDDVHPTESVEASAHALLKRYLNAFNR